MKRIKKPIMTKHSKRWQALMDIFFFASIVVLIYFSARLVLHLPGYAHYGGPDEPMHRSVVEYIAKHHAWPRWDSTELIRYSNGVSYAASSAIVYWLHAWFFEIFGIHRMGSLFLFCILLIIIAGFYFQQRLIGMVGLAFITPQVLLIFSYVNTDVATAMIAFLFGISIAKLCHSPEDKFSLYFFFAMAAACLTTKMHMWAMGFVAFLYALFTIRKKWAKLPKRHLLAALFLAMVIASWWPITSYHSNDGDIIGFTADRRAMEKFGDPNRPSWARPWPDFNKRAFIASVSKSFYGLWGWMKVPLPKYNYAIALFLLFLLFAWLFFTLKEQALFYILFFALNLALLVFICVYIEYQAQGRYLFPSYFLVIGMAMMNLRYKFQAGERVLFSSMALVIAIFLIILNIYHISLLSRLVLLR